MASSTDLWTILIITSLAHSAFVVLFLFLKKEHQQTRGKWLLLLLLSLFWLQLEFLSVRWPYDVGLSLFYGTRHGSWLLVGPLFYYYLKSLIGKKVERHEYVYLIPFLLFTVLLPLFLQDFLSFRQVHYGMLTPFDRRPDAIDFWQYVYSGVFVGQFFYLFYFLLEGKSLIDKYRKSLKQYYSQLESGKVQLLHILWFGMLLILIMSTLFLFILFFTEIYRRHLDYLYVIPTSVLVYALSYRVFGVSLPAPENAAKYQKSGLKKEDAALLKQQLGRVISDEKLFLRKGLKLNELAEKLEVSNHQLSEVLNQHLQISFFDLINQYRVEEAKKRIKEHPQYTLLQIAHDSGFNNKTSFVNAFKRFEGLTPSQYHKSLR